VLAVDEDVLDAEWASGRLLALGWSVGDPLCVEDDDVGGLARSQHAATALPWGRVTLPKTRRKAQAARPVQVRYAGLGLLATD
jgi:hypothetical protein